MDRIFEYKGMSAASSKNSKRICGKRLIMSERAMAYKSWLTPQLERDAPAIKQEINGQYPAYIHFHFIFPDKRRRDLINMLQIIADIMQETGILPDDDYTHFVPIFEYPDIDKNNPGFIMYVEHH